MKAVQIENAQSSKIDGRMAGYLDIAPAVTGRKSSSTSILSRTVGVKCGKIDFRKAIFIQMIERTEYECEHANNHNRNAHPFFLGMPSMIFEHSLIKQRFAHSNR